MKNYNITDKTGRIVAAQVVKPEQQDMMIIADDGTMIRTAVSDVARYGRVTQGVRVMRLSEGASVISVTLMDHEDDEGGEVPEDTLEPTPEQPEPTPEV